MAVFNLIPNPVKRMFLCRDATHMTLYSDMTRLEMLAQEGKKFLVEHLIDPYC